jgi:hypothetical protein
MLQTWIGHAVEKEGLCMNVCPNGEHIIWHYLSPNVSSVALLVNPLHLLITLCKVQLVSVM